MIGARQREIGRDVADLHCPAARDVPHRLERHDHQRRHRHVPHDLAEPLRRLAHDDEHRRQEERVQGDQDDERSPDDAPETALGHEESEERA